MRGRAVLTGASKAPTPGRSKREEHAMYFVCTPYSVPRSSFGARARSRRWLGQAFAVIPRRRRGVVDAKRSVDLDAALALLWRSSVGANRVGWANECAHPESLGVA